jgi:hypothetical protein
MKGGWNTCRLWTPKGQEVDLGIGLALVELEAHGERAVGLQQGLIAGQQLARLQGLDPGFREMVPAAEAAGPAGTEEAASQLVGHSTIRQPGRDREPGGGGPQTRSPGPRGSSGRATAVGSRNELCAIADDRTSAISGRRVASSSPSQAGSIGNGPDQLGLAEPP